MPELSARMEEGSGLARMRVDSSEVGSFVLMAVAASQRQV
jgi:hypothetical protein